MNGQQKYDIIKSLVGHDSSNKQRVALELGCTLRSVNRIIAGCKEHGKEFFVHGNCGRKPVTALSDETRKLILDLYRTKYYDANFTHFSELLETHEGIQIVDIANWLVNE